MPSNLRGQFLIAARRLRDPNFFKSVVLMVEHGADGAMGLIVNRPSSVTVSAALSEHFDFPENDEPVYVGGPVEPSALFVLHDSAEIDESEKPVVPGVFVGGSASVFENVVRSVSSGESDVRFRVLSGCAGWGPGQLEGELARGDWLLFPADAGLALGEDPYELWDRLVQRISDDLRVFPPTPGNPEWN